MFLSHDALWIADDVMVGNWPKSAWYLYRDKLKIYIRNQRLPDVGGSYKPILCIANMSMRYERDKGKGILTEFLDKVEPHYDVMVENVINDRLHGYLQRREYEAIYHDWEPTPISYKKIRG